MGGRDDPGRGNQTNPTVYNKQPKAVLTILLIFILIRF